MRHTALDIALMNIISNAPTDLQAELGQGANMPRRYFLQKPFDTGSFVLPIKQSFVKNARLMPGTRCMLALLAGWAGKGRVLQTTQGSIAKHVGRSVRQVYRYLKDAAREGYLSYAYTKNRIGMITGIKIFLSAELIKADVRKYQKTAQKREKQARTHTSDTNENIFINYKYDDELEERLERLRLAMLQNPK